MGKIKRPSWDDSDKRKGNVYDVLDLVVSVLMEQEERLDKVLYRLEKITAKLNEKRKALDDDIGKGYKHRIDREL